MFISVHDLKITQVFSSFTSNTLHLVSTTKTEVIPPLVENRQSWSTCKPFFIGLNYCTAVAYSNASSTDSSSYYPLTGDTRSEMLSVPTQRVLTSYLMATEQGQEKMLCVVDVASPASEICTVLWLFRTVVLCPTHLKGTYLTFESRAGRLHRWVGVGRCWKVRRHDP